MEYEIADEERLFDPSTNPSLTRQLPSRASPGQARKRGRPLKAGAGQKAEPIPEEDPAA